ncbi:hypothetical protein CLOM_g8943 [Closterium sp. NIES-68]|nr:hypothetical protein CLOM_g8943 [Closterium sp. NIES-68]
MGRFADLCEFLLPDEGEEASSESESKSGSGSKSDSVAATASPSSHKERGVGSKRAARMWWGACALVIGFAVLVRLCTGLHPYSGMHTPPRFGDYEAQRHWMEITVNLPPSQWYRNSSVNDLSWWGLDYPPLTAWQSRAHGWVVRWFCPDAVALGTSQGYESAYSKALLRWTVLSTDLLVFFPAALAFACSPFVRSLSPSTSRPAAHRLWVLGMLLLQPGLILIDHGHFQYNSISLGLSLAAATAIISRHYLIGSALFCFAINHKHMALYFAPAFFAHLLGRCRQAPRPVLMFLSLAATVLLSFALPWAPFLDSPDSVLQVVTRLFPLGRGLYEDHVANFWCATSPLIKWKQLFSTPVLARIALAATVASALPSMLHQVMRPSAHGLVLCMLNSSLGFFFFAFQVHEKSILLPLLPVSMLALHHPHLHRWFTTVAAVSMFPLLLRDRLEIAYVALLALFLLLSPPPPPPPHHPHPHPHPHRRPPLNTPRISATTAAAS